MAYVSKINGYDVKDVEARANITAETTAREEADTALGSRITAETVKMIEISWADLKTLRDEGKLVKGMQYRITDYVTTTVLAGTRSAGHPFDIIVTADSESVLNENARAALHAGDTYFESQNLSAWKVKYCLDNDSTRFSWADTTNGKGVVYRFIDEKENDLPYDFKNIQFLRYKVSKYLVNEAKWANAVSALNSQISSVPSLRWGNVSNDSAEEAIDDNSQTWYENETSTVTLTNDNTGWWKVDDEYDMFILGSGESKYFYTFSQLTSDTDEATDSSLLNTVFKNYFGIFKSRNILSLGKNVFIGNSFYSNTVGNNFYSNTVGNDFYSNTVGNSFNYNTVGNNFYSNTVGNYFNYNTVGNYFYSNTVGNSFNYNTVGNDFYSNTVGNYYCYNHIEDGVSKLNFNVNGTSSSYVQKYRVLAGTAPTSSQTVAVTTGNVIPYNIKLTDANTISISAA